MIKVSFKCARTCFLILIFIEIMIFAYLTIDPLGYIIKTTPESPIQAKLIDKTMSTGMYSISTPYLLFENESKRFSVEVDSSVFNNYIVGDQVFFISKIESATHRNYYPTFYATYDEAQVAIKGIKTDTFAKELTQLAHILKIFFGAILGIVSVLYMNEKIKTKGSVIKRNMN